MKTPEEIKKGLVEAIEDASCVVEYGDAHDLIDAVEKNHVIMADAIAYIQQLETKVPKWISVEDRLPEAKLAVLAYGRRHIRKTEITELPAQHVAYTRGEDEGWFTWDCGDYVYVSHWMPLPEPPEEEEK